MKGRKDRRKEKDRSEIVGVELNCESAAQYKEAWSVLDPSQPWNSSLWCFNNMSMVQFNVIKPKPVLWMTKTALWQRTRETDREKHRECECVFVLCTTVSRVCDERTSANRYTGWNHISCINTGWRRKNVCVCWRSLSWTIWLITNIYQCLIWLLIFIKHVKNKWVALLNSTKFRRPVKAELIKIYMTIRERKIQLKGENKSAKSLTGREREKEKTKYENVKINK